ncbi:hypothetical protein FRC10_011412 [Ceratobasidium sp. 414]|nr:hypothetical protein FRC10_011412 [Ceratobasidium sp. 414]
MSASNHADQPRIKALGEPLHSVRILALGSRCIIAQQHVNIGLAADGVDVAVNDVPQKQDKLLELVKEIELVGRKSVAIPGDVSKESDVKSMVAKTVEELGSLDIVCFSPLHHPLVLICLDRRM